MVVEGDMMNGWIGDFWGAVDGAFTPLMKL